MRTLYESILDDEDVVIARAARSGVKEKKEKIISFIEENYTLVTSTNYRDLNIRRYIRVNKDWSVDILDSKNIRHRYLLRVKPLYGENRKGTLPTKLFTWNHVPELELDCSEIDSLPVMPKECNVLRLYNCEKLKSIDLKDTNIPGTFEVRSSKELKNINLNSGKEIFNLKLYYLPKLESLTGLPDKILNQLVLYACPSLSKLSPSDVLSITCYKCDSLSEEEMKVVNYKMKQIIPT